MNTLHDRYSNDTDMTTETAYLCATIGAIIAAMAVITDIRNINM